MTRFGGPQGGSRRRLMVSAAAVLLVLGGVGAIAVGLASQQSAPTPATAEGSPTQTISAPATTSSGQAGPPPPQVQILPAARPTAISIPSIGVESPVTIVGRNPDGTMEVPQPGPDYDKAAWYKFSPTPGELGPAVIIGHIDSAESGPSVFYQLGAMRPGQQVSVQRADGTVAVFTVDRVEQYDKDSFPTLEVYGNTDTAQLRLITCGGEFDSSTGNYVDNIVVYAHLTGSHPADRGPAPPESR